MALIRVVRPGHPVRPELFIDLGYARGRVSVAHGGPMGGPLEPNRYVVKGVTLPDPRPPRLGGNRGYPESPPKPRCPVILPILGEQCARYVHGHQDHRSAEALRRDRLRRLARRR